MKLFRKILFVLGSITLAVGIWVGLHFLDRDNESNAAAVKEIKVLFLQDMVSLSLLDKFEEQSGIRVKMTTAKSPEELWLKFTMEQNRYDLVSLMSYQIPHAIADQQITEIRADLVPNLKNVSADFLDLPNGPDRGYHVPLLWGLTGIIYNNKKALKVPRSWEEILNHPDYRKKVSVLKSTIELYRLSLNLGFPEAAHLTDENARQLAAPLSRLINFSQLIGGVFKSEIATVSQDTWIVQMNSGEAGRLISANPDWSFILPDERATLWTTALAFSPNAVSIEDAHAFIDFLLQPSSSMEMMETNSMSSTNKSIEKENISEMLKPSYLRKIPLKKILYISDFSSGTAVLDALAQAANRRGFISTEPGSK